MTILNGGTVPAQRAVMGVSATDMITDDGTTLTFKEAVDRAKDLFDIDGYYVYFSSTQTLSYADRIKDIPSNMPAVISTKKYVNDSQWVKDWENFRTNAPSTREAELYAVMHEEMTGNSTMTAAEFVRRANSIRHVFDGWDYVVPSINFQDYDFNPGSIGKENSAGKVREDYRNYLYPYLKHIGYSTYASIDRIKAGKMPAPGLQIAHTVTAMAQHGLTHSSFGWGAAVVKDRDPIGGAFREQRAQWLYDSAQLLVQGGAQHLLWFDIDWTPKDGGDERLRVDPALIAKWNEAKADVGA